jgi:hypothetical protein
VRKKNSGFFLPRATGFNINNSGSLASADPQYSMMAGCPGQATYDTP